MINLVKQIFSPQTKFEGINNIDRLCLMFSRLYRIDLYKEGLDLILTKLHQKHLFFEVKLIKNWDTNVGCFLTQQQSFFDKTIGKVINKNSLKIILRNLSYNVLAHEMAHAVDFESKINLNEEFAKCIYFDMNNNQSTILTLKSESKRLMIDALKSYPPNQHISELFARYFELLSISRDVCENGNFTTTDVINYFSNTTKFVTDVLNPKLKTQTNKIIANKTLEIVKNIKINDTQEKFSEKINSFHQKKGSLGEKSWSKNTKSNSSYYQAWQKYQQIEDKTNK